MPDLPKVLHFELEVGHILSGVVWLRQEIESLHKDVFMCKGDLHLTGVDGTQDCVYGMSIPVE